MLRCPTCQGPIALSLLLQARAPSFKWQRESMRFRLTCPTCGDAIGVERSTGRIFFGLWLCPLPFLAWLTQQSGLTQAHFVLALPVAWLLLFPMFWLGRIPLASLGPPRT